MRTRIPLPALLLVAPLAAACGRARAATPHPSYAAAVVGVAGNCAAADVIRPAGAGTMADGNGDGYVCTRRLRSIAGDILRLTVDNDAAHAVGGRAEPDAYRGM